MITANSNNDRGKMINVTRSSLPPLDEYVDEIRQIWDSRWLTNMGEKHREFQLLLQDYLGVSHIELMVNGHMALEMVLQAMHLKGKVITTPFTFASTSHAIVRNGLTPVFCDIRSDDYTMDADSIEKLITADTCAILPVHVYGNICDVERIDAIARKYNLRVIYDAAHAFGETLNGIPVGLFGDASIFSFHATKVFHSIEGGGVVFHDERLGRELYRLKNFGIRDEETVDGIGANAKMNEFCAAMGICNLRHIGTDIEKRSSVIDHYRKRLGNIDGITLNGGQDNVKSNYGYFPVVFDETKCGVSRNQVADSLRRQGINSRKYFYPIVSDYICYKDRYDSGKTPVAKWVADRVLTLPVYPDLPMEVADRVCDIIMGMVK